MQKFQLRGVPSTVIIDKDGYLVGKLPGYMPLPSFTKRITYFVEKHNSFMNALSKINTQSNDTRPILIVAEGYYQREDCPKAVVYAEKIITKDPENNLGSTAKAHVIRAGCYLIQQENPENALKHLDTVLEKWPKSDSAKIALYTKGLVYIYKKDTDSARKYLLQFKEKYPGELEFGKRIDILLKKI